MTLSQQLREAGEKATPGEWVTDNFLCEGDHQLRIGERWKAGQPLATIAHVEHNWNDCGPQDRRISWKEAETNAALIVLLRNNLDTIIAALEAQEAGK
jgi:hypothetical protein